MEEENDEETLINKLIKHNEGIISTDSSLTLKHYCKEKKKEGYSAIFEVDTKTFQVVMRTKKINTGWERCTFL